MHLARRPLILAALALLVAASSASADGARWKKMECSAVGNTAIGTTTNRAGLCVLNTDEAITICVSERSNQTCNGTVVTDGFPISPGAGFCETETSSGAPAINARYCRAASGTPVLGLKETHR